MSVSVSVRRARPEEFEALGEITAAAYVGDGLLNADTDRPYLGVLRDVADRAATAEVLVAVDGAGTVLGGVTFVAGPGPYADLARPDEAEFRTLAVAGASRGLGVGEALVRACIDRAHAIEGCARLVISTQPSMAAAGRLYRRLNFVRIPDRDWMPVPHITLLTYGLDLEPPG
ncbi:MAG: GNAT family N-acetyltransferase [Terracoccus sp.]